MSKKKKLQIVSVGRRFLLKRTKDYSGISGIGFVAFGIVLPSKEVLIEWTVGNHISKEEHKSIEDLLAIHGHNGSTIIEWIDANELYLISEGK